MNMIQLSYFALALLICSLSAPVQGQNGLPAGLGQVKTIESPDPRHLERFILAIEKATPLLALLDVQESEAKVLEIRPYMENEWGSRYNLDSQSLFINSIACSEAGAEAVMIHEFAHSIFTANLRPHLQKEMDETNRNDRRYSEIVSFRPRDAVALRASVREMQAPFDELFADTLAVLTLDDPKALWKFLNSCGGKDVVTRDFSAVYPIEGWNVGILDMRLGRHHDLLNPTRTEIWKIYGLLGPTLETKQKILRALVDSSVKVIKTFQRRRLNYLAWSMVNQEKLNRELIQEMQAHLRVGGQASN